jgi:predicted AAA+ superfamily ATPase
VITGIRRCGKSSLLLLFQETILKHTDKSHIISINFEDAEFDVLLTYRDLNSYILSKMTDQGRYYIFLDEIQIVENWEKCEMFFVQICRRTASSMARGFYFYFFINKRNWLLTFPILIK